MLPFLIFFFTLNLTLSISKMVYMFYSLAYWQLLLIIDFVIELEVFYQKSTWNTKFHIHEIFWYSIALEKLKTGNLESETMNVFSSEMVFIQMCMNMKIWVNATSRHTFSEILRLNVCLWIFYVFLCICVYECVCMCTHKYIHQIHMKIYMY